MMHLHNNIKYGSDRQRFIFFEVSEVTNKKAQTLQEFTNAVEGIDANLKTMSADEAIKGALEKISTAEQDSLKWRKGLDFTTDYSKEKGDAGTAFDEEIPKAAAAARTKIEVARATYEGRRKAIEAYTKYELAAPPLKEEHRKIFPLLKNASLFTEIADTDSVATKSADVDSVKTSFENLGALHGESTKYLSDMEALHKSLADVKDLAGDDLKTQIGEQLTEIQGGIDEIKPLLNTMVTSYNASLSNLKTELPARVTAEQKNIEKYQKESGDLQTKAKTPGQVKNVELTDAYNKFTGQQDFVKKIGSFSAEVAGMQPLTGVEASGTAPIAIAMGTGSASGSVEG